MSKTYELPDDFDPFAPTPLERALAADEPDSPYLTIPSDTQLETASAALHAAARRGTQRALVAGLIAAGVGLGLAATLASHVPGSVLIQHGVERQP